MLRRIQDKNFNKKSLEALIMCGALDQLEERGLMLANSDTLLSYNRECAHAPRTEDTLFGALGKDITAPDLILKPACQASAEDKLRSEKELLGLYISGHPLDKIKDKLSARDTNINKIKSDYKEGASVLIAGVVEQIKPIFTKKGDKMLFMTISDFSDKIEIVIFPSIFAEYKDFLEPQNCLAINGRVSHRNGSVSLIANSIKKI
jgi:DNA polymerase III subunit alpha